jgi:hypothetical protein
VPAGARGLIGLGAIIGIVTWLPPFVLAGLEHTLTSGPAVPFLFSLATHARLLVAIPLLFVAEAVFDRRVRQVIDLMRASELVPAGERPRLDAALMAATRARDSWLLEGAAVAFAVFLARAGTVSGLPAGVTTWREMSGVPTLAGSWEALVSLTVFRFLVLRWGIRLLIWWRLVWRISRLNLQLVPTHPDRVGGLGGLGVAQVGLSPLSVGGSFMLAAGAAEQVLFAGVAVQQFATPLVSFVAASMLVFVTPLLFFWVQLLNVRQTGLLEYGALAHEYVRAFDAKWLRAASPPAEPLVGSADVQSLADMAGSFEVVGTMRLVPISLTQALTLAGSALVPALPLVLFIVPLDELILTGFRGLLGL